MQCRRCASTIDRPGDYCLVCRTRNADTVVLDVDSDEATLTMVLDDDVQGVTTVTTVPERDGRRRVVERRNFAGRIADEIQRKRPDGVYATGDRESIAAVRERLHYDVYRIEGEDPVETVVERRGQPALDVVELDPVEKIGGRHTTLIGGRRGLRAVRVVASHPHVKKVIPGPIDAGGMGSQTGLRAKITRPGSNGNLRLLLRDGSSVQENRVVTTARDVETGERVGEELDELLADADLQS